MKQGSMWFLRAAILLMGLIGLVICVFALPSIPDGANAEFPGANNLLYVLVAGLYLAAIPFYIALYHAFKLLNNIGKNQAFSQASVNSLKSIKYCGIGVSVCFVASIPFLFHVAELDDAPGLGLVALAFTCSPLVIATFAGVLQNLLQNAINIKSENDLTV